MRNILRKWLGLTVLESKVKEHETDLVRVMDKQLQLQEQYPLHDIRVVPTEEQTKQINAGGPDGNIKNIQG